MKSITKQYGSLYANRDVSLVLKKGEVLAVVGENGAGKSTLMKVLYGLEQADAGSIFLNGEEKSIKKPSDAIKLGIGMVQQHFMLFPEFSVAENIVYGNEPKKKKLFFDRKKAVQITKELSERYLLQVSPEEKVKNCSVGLQQRVEILKVLNQNADIVILDEPSAVLTLQEVKELFKTIRQLISFGKSVIIITHKLREVMEISDRVMVMRHGVVVDVKNTSETNIEELSYLMVGRHLAEKEIVARIPGEDVMVAKDLSFTNERGIEMLKRINLHVRAGEIVGIAGVSGNGQSELIACLTGLLKPNSGKVSINNIDTIAKTPGQIRDIGCACIPEDRYMYGCASGANLIETSIMGHQNKKNLSAQGVLKSGNINNFTQNLLQEHDVRYSTFDQKAGELSGGNIQKLIVARELEQNTNFLIAAEPTRGVDIGAMEFIHAAILKRREEGCGILLVSSELSEILKLSDRIYTIFAGEINTEFARKDTTEEKLGLAMMGGSKGA